MNKKIVVIIQICGGLGNQLFQYLFAISNFSEERYQIIFDCSDLVGEGVKRPFVLNKIGLPGNFMHCIKIEHINQQQKKILIKNVKWLSDACEDADLQSQSFDLVQEKSTNFQKISQPFINTYYRGYWQSIDYWDRPVELINSVWQHISESSKYRQAMEIVGGLQIDADCCAVHIRGGDYLEFLDFHGVCGGKYYDRAMDIANASKFHIYTDDIVHASKICKEKHNLKFVSNQIEDDLLEFICLTEYKNFIIPNSSFSYLAACFASVKNKDANVVCPYPWYSTYMSGPTFPKGWVALNRSSGNLPQEDCQKIMQASVTVVMPVHARDEHLETVIDSIMNQTHLPIEIIVSQNNASQNVKNEVSRLASKNELIKVIDTTYPDSLSYARNVAIRQANGEYVAFIDDDDYWMPNKLELQIQAAVKMGAGLVASNFHEFNEELGIFSRSSYKSWRGESWIRVMNQGNPFAGGSAAMVRRDIFDRVGYFDEAMPSCEDHDMWWRIAISGETLFFLEDDLVGIRKNSRNISNNEEFMVRGHLIHLSKMLGEKQVKRDEIRKYYVSLRNALDKILREENGNEATIKSRDLIAFKSQNLSYYLARVMRSQIHSTPMLSFIKKIMVQLKEEFRKELWGTNHSENIKLNNFQKLYFLIYLLLRVCVGLIMLPWDFLVYCKNRLRAKKILR